ncbi:hypothetical protein FHT86_005748 [Rhizobium sp. BK313]|nr:hypothetical protein [Rhizobium sp. BK313]
MFADLVDSAHRASRQAGASMARSEALVEREEEALEED